MTLPDSKLGDKGQRYVVSARWDGIIREVGYCNADYEKFADAFLLHPSIDRVTVIDRQHPDLVDFLATGNGNPSLACIYRKTKPRR